jgi:Conjugative transposon protein TcpC
MLRASARRRRSENAVRKQDTGLASPPPDVAERWLDERAVRKGKQREDRRIRARLRQTHAHGSGGRWIVWLARAVIWAVLMVLLMLGIQALLRPHPPLPPPPVVAEGADVAFPVHAAEAFAVRFASVYLEWDATDQTSRAQRLAPYVPDGVEQQLGWAGNGRQVAVLVLPVQTAVISDTAAIVTVAAEITGIKEPRWVHLSVPVSTDGQGRFVVTDTPVLVPGPSEAAAPQEPVQTADSELTSELHEPLTAFFRAYAGTEPGQLEYLLAPGVKVGTLGGMVEFEDLRLSVPRGGDRRDALAKVRWVDPVTQSTFTQSYQVTVAKRQDGRWYIEQLGAHIPAAPPPHKEN